MQCVCVHPPCPCDAQNLLWAGTLILGSCTAAHRLALKEALGPTPNGISLIVWIVQKRHLVQSSHQRKLITELEKLTLSDMPGEDVDALNVKIRKSCKEILQVGPPIRHGLDLHEKVSFLSSACLLQCHDGHWYHFGT